MSEGFKYITTGVNKQLRLNTYTGAKLSLSRERFIRMNGELTVQSHHPLHTPITFIKFLENL